jgi:hypothetical protein
MAGLSDMLKDPNFIARLLMEERMRKEAEAAAAEQAGPQMGPLPNMPPMPGPEARNYRRPGSGTAQAEQMLSDAMAAPLAGGFYGGQEIGEGAMHRSPGEVGSGAAGVVLSMIPAAGAKRRPVTQHERFGDAGTSHIGMLPPSTATLGAVGGGYAGSQFDDKDSNKGATLGAIVGGTAGFGLGMIPVLRHMDRQATGPNSWGGPDPAWEAKLAAARAKHIQSPAPQPGPAAAQPAAKAEPPMTLSRRLREYESFMPPPRQSMSPNDLAGPTGGKGIIKNSKGEDVYQTAHGWKNRKTNTFTDPPDKDAMTSGFSDADLSAARKK